MNEITKLRKSITEKPCRKLGYCPYGHMVENIPVLEPTREEAIEHNEYLKKALADGTFDNPNRECIMDRKMAEDEIRNFNPKKYSVKSKPGIECLVFGHYCPVQYWAEPFIDDEE